MNRPETTILLSNRQRLHPVSLREVRRVVQAVLEESRLSAELGIHFVSARRSALLNDRHLAHTGPTDILTFDYGSTATRLHGELFICVAEAVRQAAEFRTTPRAELLRYVIHGMLHLQGFDDLDPARRRVMKRAENRLVARVVPRRPARVRP